MRGCLAQGGWPEGSGRLGLWFLWLLLELREQRKGEFSFWTLLLGCSHAIQSNGFGGVERQFVETLFFCDRCIVSLVFCIGDAADLRANSFLELAFRSAGKAFRKKRKPLLKWIRCACVWHVCAFEQIEERTGFGAEPRPIFMPKPEANADVVVAPRWGLRTFAH